ncbi:hypothetical protein [Vibrio metschnikovii]|uniref:hypothetical protein n=1 Tax=Vibrio metschnikovii TaxID=28172 RepID=UPI002FCBD8DD
MFDAFAVILREYGFKAVWAFAVLFIVKWILVHQMAEPGSTVSLSWGLIEYTKKKDDSSIENDGLTLASSEKGLKTSVQESAATTIFVIDVVEETYELALKELRESYKLRPLRNLESGSKIEDVGNQTYFFTLTTWLGLLPLDSITAHLHYSYKYDFELHKDIDSNLFLVGFMTPSDAQHLSSTHKRELKHLLISSKYIDGFSSLVRLPFNYISKIESRNIGTAQNKEVEVLQFQYKK